VQQYFVIDPAGKPYGPADLVMLQQWANEGRIQPGSTLRDAATGQSMPASSLPGLFPAPGATHGQGPYSAPSSYANYPRTYGGYGMDDGSKDVQTAWIYAVLGILCCPIVFSILGVITAKRALDKGNRMGQGPLILSWVGIGLMILGAILRVAAMSM
jgi:hypothetical protein